MPIDTAALTNDYAHLDWGKTADIAPTVPALLAWNISRNPDRELLVIDDQRMTYADACRRSAEFARLLLGHGLGKGARVGLLMPNGTDLLASWFACLRIGAVAVPISTLSAPAELVRILRSSGVALLITTDRLHAIDFLARLAEALGLRDDDPAIACPDAPLLRAIWLWRGEASWARRIDAGAATPVPSAIVAAAEAGVVPADEATIVYTSGSTSEPKGVVHSHGNFVRSAQRWCASMPFRADDRFFANSPMFWVGGLITSLLTCMQAGATLVTSISPDPGALLDIIEGERCSMIQVWPFMDRRLTEHPSFAGRSFPAMRAGTCTAMLPPERRPIGGNKFGWAMGMTETAGPHSSGMASIDEGHRGAMGLLAPGMEHRIVDPETGAILPEGERGELHVRGDTLMLGYVGRERSEVFDHDGWFATGDICSIRDMHLFFHGRRDAMIKTAGANVAPAEVEAALVQAEGVAEAHVLGLADETKGQIVGALIVPRAGEHPDPAAIVGTARALLSPYKVPRRLLVVETIPTTGTNKLDRRAATRLLEERGEVV
jgi:acyl-CoA synthetase (AMP-forming)/AMP-acid ligase II